MVTLVAGLETPLLEILAPLLRLLGPALGALALGRTLALLGCGQGLGLNRTNGWLARSISLNRSRSRCRWTNRRRRARCRARSGRGKHGFADSRSRRSGIRFGFGFHHRRRGALRLRFGNGDSSGFRGQNRGGRLFDHGCRRQVGLLGSCGFLRGLLGLGCRLGRRLRGGDRFFRGSVLCCVGLGGFAGGAFNGGACGHK